MTDQPHADESASGKPVENQALAVAVPPPPADRLEKLSPASEPAPAKKLSAEEQMALYEKDLKENDWGHQPC